MAGDENRTFIVRRQDFRRISAASCGGGVLRPDVGKRKLRIAMTDDDEKSRAAADAGGIEGATKRLAAALDGLEAALDRRREADRADVATAAQISTLGADRSRLAAELDQQTARAHRLEATSREVTRRLDLAMDAIRTVVDTNGR